MTTPRKILEAMYFTETQTGGGCTALTYGDAEPTGSYLMITSGDAEAPTDESTEFMLGRYDCETRDQVGEVVEGSFIEILRAARPYIDKNAWNEGMTEVQQLALDAACLAVQKALGITDGGTASVVFSGSNQDEFDTLIDQYVEAELLT